MLEHRDGAPRESPVPPTAAQRFAGATRWIVARLPFGLSAIVAPTLVGYLAINALTFSVDLTGLTALHGGLHWPLPAAITVSYALAFGLSFALNRALNFRAHRELGRQLGVYVVVVALNYLVWILGLTDGLAALGLDYRLARLVAAVGEAAYLYCALRWVVFRRVTPS